MKLLIWTLALTFTVFSPFSSNAQGSHDHNSPTKKVGVLILAHGGKSEWNDQVNKVAAEIRRQHPTEVAFGMASKQTIQTAIDRLQTQDVASIVAVPLFISSNSTVITSTEFLLGLRKDAPKDLATFAKMDHGGHDVHAAHGSSDKMFDPMTPVECKVPITMKRALDSDPIVAEILLARAKAISKDAKNEVVIVVAHGPVSDETNRLWLNDMSKIAEMVKAKSDFRRIDYLTLRDDAPEPIRGQATAEFRRLVERASADKARVLIVPLLLSFGGIEEGVKKRLDGLEYVMTSQALLPDQRIVKWVQKAVEAHH